MVNGVTTNSRTVHVEHCMGTVFSFDIRDPGDWSPTLAEATSWLHEVDSTFSTYRDDSVVRQLARGAVDLAGCSAQVQEVFALCDEVSRASNGYFSIRSDRDPDQLDPSGLVKGWAIERTSDLLLARGSRNHAVNGGGDIQIAGEAAPGQAWRVGITAPLDRTRVLTVVTGRDLAVATSGIGERGAHIMNPQTGAPAGDLASVTIVGDKLTWVDAYATAAFAMGPAGQEWVEALPGYEALIVTRDGTMRSTSGFGRFTAEGAGRHV